MILMKRLLMPCSWQVLLSSLQALGTVGLQCYWTPVLNSTAAHQIQYLTSETVIEYGGLSFGLPHHRQTPQAAV